MKFQVIEKVAGTTFKPTFVSSGASFSPIHSALFNGSGTLVHSMTAVDSGNGFYFALHPVPNTPGFYVNRWWGVLAANTYSEAQFLRSRFPEVD